MDNLGSTFIPNNSPLANSTSQDAYSFDAENERNAINTAKIRNLSFSKASGGTLTLGGPGNGNGVLVVEDSGGTPRINFGYTGGTITNGNLVILNDSAGTILDNKGVVNQTLLTYGAFSTSGGAQDVVGTAVTTYTASTINLNLYRQNAVIFFLDLQTYSTGTASVNLTTGIYVDGTQQGNIYENYIDKQNIIRSNSMHSLNTLSSGTHEITLKGFLDTTGSVRLYNWRFTYIIIGS